ncbi:MAG: hypothetical protein LUC47_05145 [Clostridiales bacterium]|nr:hypothetical protein [Clostridiales bacterium]
MYVNNSVESSGNISSSDITAAKNLADTYAVVLTSRPTLDAVAEQTGVDYTYSELCDMIETESVNDTEIIQITVTSSNAEEAALIANAIADIAPDDIMEIVSGSSVKIVEHAVVAERKKFTQRQKLHPGRHWHRISAQLCWYLARVLLTKRTERGG